MFTVHPGDNTVSIGVLEVLKAKIPTVTNWKINNSVILYIF